MERPSQGLTTDLFALNRIPVRAVTCFLAGHGCLRGYFHKMGIYKNEHLCRHCNDEEETATHILFEKLTKCYYTKCTGIVVGERFTE